MEIIKYQPNKVPSSELIELLRVKYGNSKNFDYFLNDYKKAFAFCVDNENITFLPMAIYEETKMLAHTALMIDKRLKTEEAFFGFLEVPEDEEVFELIWGTLKKEALIKGISVLKGPVNGSIWHQYRCIQETDSSEFFKSELFTEQYYSKFLESNNPVSETEYYSARRENLNGVIQILKNTESTYKKLSDAGFLIKDLKDISLDELREVASLSKKVFNSSWGYTELTEKEFLTLYSSEKLDAHLDKMYLLYKDKNMIGFCGTFREDVTTLICKTICLLPEYQGLGLGNALAYKIHIDAEKEGIKKIIYALIRKENNIKNFPQIDILIFRRYVAFEFHI